MFIFNLISKANSSNKTYMHVYILTCICPVDFP